MATSHLIKLDLSLDQARSATDYHESYANTTGRDLESQEAGIRGEDADSAERADAQWALTVEMASALREAASWAVYFDVNRARGLLARSGFLYQLAGLAFGSFLLTVAGSPPMEEFSRDIAMLSQLHGQSGQPNRVDIPSSLYHPQQQTYLLLACAGMADRLDSSRRELQDSDEAPDPRRPIHAIAEGSPNLLGVLPFGALGTPLRVAWDVGVHLLQASSSDSLDVVAKHLTGLCRRYDEMMNLARVNDHLWKHAAAPVDVGDIELIGITTLSVSHFGRNNLAQAVMENGLDPNGISFIPFDLGVELAEGLAEPH
jgi:hypothetical protein